MSLANDCKVYRYGTADDDQNIAAGIGANVQLYEGEVAVLAGTGPATVGYLKSGASIGFYDTCIGIVGDPTGGVYQTGPGVLGGTTDGAVWVEVLTGAFYFQSGSGADQLSATTNGKTVYYGGTNATGPIACLTNAANTRPVLGVQSTQDPGIAAGFLPGAGYWPVVVNPGVRP
jgi:hypothetical protein